MALIDKLNTIDGILDRVITGKSNVATAITQKGVTTASNASFATLVTNIGKISSGGSLPSGISAVSTGSYTVSTAFTTTRQTITHGLGVTPDLVIFFATANVATSNSMLLAMRSGLLNYRNGYNLHSLYHGNNTSTVTYLNSNSTTYGVSNMTATTFQIASVNSSYYWRAGTYKWLAIKFS